MSRIAGIVQHSADARLTTSFVEMLSSLGSKADQRRSCSAGERAAIGWCGGRAPNVSEAHGVITAMDGCIYNRDELGRADTDAELICSLYARNGFEAAIRRLNGDFAIALYDPRIEALWLARDRFGVKPLYFVATPRFFAFASCPRALLSLPGVSREVNRQFVALFAASHYRYFDNTPDRSPYEGVAQLPAAHVLRVANGSASKSTYWSLQDAPDYDDPEAELAVRYRDLLLNAVSLRQKSSRHPAFTLSGGMDSSSVLACAVHNAGAKQRAFSTVYSDPTYDESQEIRSTRNDTVSEWHPISVGNPDLLNLLPRMIEAHDEPVATATWLSHFLLCEEASKQGAVTLFGGLGGDELNAGEYEHFFYRFADLRRDGQEQTLANEVRCWAQHHDHPIYRKNAEVVEDAFRRLVDFTQPGRCLADRRRLNRHASALNREYFDLPTFEPVMDHPFGSYLKSRTHQDLTRETIPCCLRAEDRQSAAFGLNHVDPFLDHRLVEFMYRVPGSMKIRDGVTKILLREAMRGILPEETRNRIKKTGWNAPAHLWFSGPRLDPIRDLIRSQSFRERGIYNVDEVSRLVEEHDEIVSTRRTAENHMMFLWQLLNLEIWLRWLQSHST